MARILGIDLGTTNSCVAVVDGTNPLVVPFHDGKYTLASIVALKADGAHIVGRVAKRQAVINAETTIIASKRIIGRGFSDAQTQRVVQGLPYRCVEGENGDVRIQAHDRVFAVQEVMALILRELRDSAASHFNEQFDTCVITVPAYFGDKQRQAVIDGARIAGLEVARIINEPTAAALAYGALQDGVERKIAVYDLGGGTFDVSVLHLREGEVEVLATAGDAFLGGHDFDDRIVQWLVARLEQQQGVSLHSDRNAMQRLREAAENAKISLSEEESVEIALPFLSAARDGSPIHLQATLTREDYETMVGDLVDKTLATFSDTIKNARLAVEDIDDILMVGGMTRTPVIQDKMSQAFRQPGSAGVHPDLVVAVGAAIQGSLLDGDGSGYVLLDVTPQNLGIMSLGGRAEVIIPKDTSIPTQAHRTFTTVRDNQDQVRIVVYQGDGKKIRDNEALGEFVLSGLNPAPRGSHQIDVTFSISADGLVTVAAKDLESGQERAIDVTGSQRIDDGEMARMIADHQGDMVQTVDHQAKPIEGAHGETSA